MEVFRSSRPLYFVCAGGHGKGSWFPSNLGKMVHGLEPSLSEFHNGILEPIRLNECVLWNYQVSIIIKEVLVLILKREVDFL